MGNEDARNRAEGELQRARQLLWTASHDLCTPLAAIELSAQGLLRHCAGNRRPDRARLVESLAQIERLAKAASALVTDVLAVEKLAAQACPRSTPAPEVDVEAVFADAVALHASGLERARCSIVVRTEGGDRARARCDRLGMQRVFSNLLQNVIKHAPGAPINVDFALLAGHLRIRFADGGPASFDGGVVATAEPFQPEGLHGGHGLGLWIVNRAVAEMGGQIRTWRGPGMSFEIELPV